MQREHSRSVGSKISLSPDFNESATSAGPKWRGFHMKNKTQMLLTESVCLCFSACLCTNSWSSPDLDLLWSSLLSCPPSPTSSSALLHFRFRVRQCSCLLTSGSPWPWTSPPFDLSGAGGVTARLNSDGNKLGLCVWEREKEGRRGQWNHAF